MNLASICPEIPDNWKGGISAVCRVLGSPDKPMDYKTLRKYSDMGRKNGGIDWIPGKNGRRIFLGREVKRFWLSF